MIVLEAMASDGEDSVSVEVIEVESMDEDAEDDVVILDSSENEEFHDTVNEPVLGHFWSTLKQSNVKKNGSYLQLPCNLVASNGITVSSRIGLLHEEGFLFPTDLQEVGDVDRSVKRLRLRKGWDTFVEEFNLKK